MKLTEALQAKRAEKDILLMTHIVLGYPSFEANREIIQQMVMNGVDLMELQIPFSEPVADGPTIAKANQAALDRGTKVHECLTFAEEMSRTHNIPFLFMTYYNIIFTFGVDAFFKKAQEIGIQGFIIPDLPPEEGGDFFAAAEKYGIAPILIYAPTSTDKRMEELAGYAEGFIYCVARRGVTGAKTSFDPGFDSYVKRCKTAAKLPIAVGFGIREKADIDYLKGKADIAVIGSATINLVDQKGPGAVGGFIARLQERDVSDQ